MVAAVLHNIVIDECNTIPNPEILFDEMPQDVDDIPALEGNDGLGARRALIANHFI